MQQPYLALDFEVALGNINRIKGLFSPYESPVDYALTYNYDCRATSTNLWSSIKADILRYRFSLTRWWGGGSHFFNVPKGKGIAVKCPPIFATR